MVARNPARYLAPIALVATIAGTYLIVHDGLKTRHSTPRPRITAFSNPSQRKYAKVKFYVVQAGDSLTSISTKTGVSVTTLEALNSKVDPNNLQTAQRLRLRR